MSEDIIQKMDLPQPPRRGKSKVRRALVITCVIVTLVLVFLGDSLIEINDAPLVKVKQSLDGTLTVRIEPGVFWQGFGRISDYRKSRIMWFSRISHEGESHDQSVQVRYRDGGTAHISGSIRYILPFSDENAEESILALHKAYRSERNFLDRAIYRLLIETLQQSAGFFTSEESYTTHKATYSNHVRDQIMHGIYLVDQVPDTVRGLAGEFKILPKNVIRRDADGNYLRKANPLDEYGVSITNVTIYDPEYERGIQDQIDQRLNSKMKAIVAKSEASLRVQEQITKKAQGERDVETERYLQLVINKHEEIAADMEKRVQTILAEREAEAAQIDKRAKEWDGKAQKEMGRGQATSKRLLQQADSNLEIKLTAVKVKHKAIADALANGKPILPEIILSENAAGGTAVLEALGINAIEELAKRSKASSGSGK